MEMHEIALMVKDVPAGTNTHLDRYVVPKKETFAKTISMPFIPYPGTEIALVAGVMGFCATVERLLWRDFNDEEKIGAIMKLNIGENVTADDFRRDTSWRKC